MSTSNVVRLPGAAEQPVEQIRRRGRYPKTVARFRDASFARYLRGYQQTMIDGRVKAIERWIAGVEMSIAAARMEIRQLKGVEIGSDLAQDVAWYLEWSTWTPEAKERWTQAGKAPKRPY